MEKLSKSRNYNSKHLQLLLLMRIKLSSWLITWTMSTTQLIQSFLLLGIEFSLTGSLNLIKFRREKLWLRVSMMMVRMELVKNYFIYFKKWRLKILFWSFVYGTMAYKLVLNKLKVVNSSELLLKGPENFLTKFKNKFIKRKLIG